MGSGIHWKDFDEDISIEGLLAGKPSGYSGDLEALRALNKRFSHAVAQCYFRFRAAGCRRRLTSNVRPRIQ